VTHNRNTIGHDPSWESSYLENDRFISTAAPGGIVAAITEDSAGNMWVAYQDFGLLRLSGREVVERIPWDAFGGRDLADTLIADPVNGGLWLGFFKFRFFRQKAG
jgi:hypothetical protein